MFLPLILLVFITLITFCEEYKLWISSLCNVFATSCKSFNLNEQPNILRTNIALHTQNPYNSARHVGTERHFHRVDCRLEYPVLMQHTQVHGVLFKTS
jgi:hypothetical protein